MQSRKYQSKDTMAPRLLNVRSVQRNLHCINKFSLLVTHFLLEQILNYPQHVNHLARSLSEKLSQQLASSYFVACGHFLREEHKHICAVTFCLSKYELHTYTYKRMQCVVHVYSAKPVKLLVGTAVTISLYQQLIFLIQIFLLLQTVPHSTYIHTYYIQFTEPYVSGENESQIEKPVDLKGNPTDYSAILQPPNLGSIFLK